MEAALSSTKLTLLFAGVPDRQFLSLQLISVNVKFSFSQGKVKLVCPAAIYYFLFVSVLCRAICVLHPVREQQKSDSVGRGDTCLLAPFIFPCE